MMEQTRTLLCFCVAVLCLCLSVKVSDGAAADVASCAEALTKLITCLPYSQGASEVPTKDCCINLETVHENKPECLCALIAGSANHTAGIPNLNTTLALNLGPACNVATKPSVCPDLLDLSPSDPLNKIFTSGSTAGNSTATPTSPGSTASGSSTVPSPKANSAPAVLSMSFLGSLILAIVAISLS